MMRFPFLAVLFLAGCAAAPGLSGYALRASPDEPDRAATPGAVDPAITQASIDATICRPGFTRAERPSSRVTNALKAAQLGRGATLRAFQEDHLVPLGIGGDPGAPANLWPQPLSGSWSASDKDRIDRLLHRLVCAHAIPLAQAQAEIAADWIAAYRRHVGMNPR